MEVFTPVGPYESCLHFRELISDFLDWKGKQGQKSMHNELFLYSFQNSTCSSLTWLKQDSGWGKHGKRDCAPVDPNPSMHTNDIWTVYRNFDFSPPLLWSLPYFYGKRFLWGKTDSVDIVSSFSIPMMAGLCRMGNFRSRFWPLKNTVSVNLLSNFFSLAILLKSMDSKNTYIYSPSNLLSISFLYSIAS